MLDFIKQFTPKNSFMLVAKDLDQEMLNKAINRDLVQVLEMKTKITGYNCVVLTKLGRLERLNDK